MELVLKMKSLKIMRMTRPVPTNYFSDFQYQNGMLQFFPHAVLNKET